MILRNGDMWSAYADTDLFLITTNSYVYAGKLVMGAGIAEQARSRFPQLPQVLAQAIAAKGKVNDVYGLLVSPRWPAAKIGCFQTKIGLGPSPLWLIEHSTALLRLWCSEHPTATVCLNFPGIGCGKLDEAQVRPIMEQLPDQVQLWKN